MTKNEASWVVAFLEELSDKFSNDGCNDMYMKNTPENRELYYAFEKHWRKENKCEDEPIEEISKKAKSIGTFNNGLVEYLICKLKEEYDLKKKDIPDPYLSK